MKKIEIKILAEILSQIKTPQMPADRSLYWLQAFMRISNVHNATIEEVKAIYALEDKTDEEKQAMVNELSNQHYEVVLPQADAMEINSILANNDQLTLAQKAYLVDVLTKKEE